MPQIAESFAAGLCLVRLPDQRRQDMARLKIEIVLRAVKVRRHRGNEVRAVLPTIGRRKLQASDLGDRIGLVGRLKRPVERLFVDRLWRIFRVDAA